MNPDAIALIKQARRRDASVSTLPFETLLRLGALEQELSDADESLEAEPNRLGYLSRVVGGRQVFVPFNLAKVSPRREHFESISEISPYFCVQQNYDYCLSGSATFLGRTSAIGDLDFAEYLDPAQRNSEEELHAFCHRHDKSEAKVREIFVKNLALWTTREARDVAHPFLKSIGAIAVPGWTEVYLTGKADFFTSNLDISNKLFPVQEGFNTKASFVYQEIVISAADSQIKPRLLYDREQLYEYLKFLLEKSLSHRKGKPIKALKRIISLSLLLDLKDSFKEGLEILERKSAGQEDEARRHVSTVRNRIMKHWTRVGSELRNEGIPHE